jgi:hypothetical protein
MGEIEIERVCDIIAASVWPYVARQTAPDVLHDVKDLVEFHRIPRFSDQHLVAALDEILWRKEGR